MIPSHYGRKSPLFADREDKMSVPPRLTAVVLTHNSYQKKAGCVEHTMLALQGQNGPPCDIVVVDNGSDICDRVKLQNFLRESAPKATLVETDTSVSRARNLGARALDADAYVFLDDDCIVLSNDALQYVRLSLNTKSHGYAAQRDWTQPTGWFEEHALSVKDDLLRGDKTNLAAHASIITPEIRFKDSERCLMRSMIGHFGFVDAALFWTVGGFPEEFSGYGGEDDTLAFLCLREDDRFANLSELRVAHVNHRLSDTQATNAEPNLRLHCEVLARHNVASFRIDKLMYGEVSSPRKAIENV